MKGLLQPMKTQSYRLCSHIAVTGAVPQLKGIHMRKGWLSVWRYLQHWLQSWLLPQQGLLTPHPPAPLLHAGCSAEEPQPWTSPAKLGQINTEKVVLTAGKKLFEKCFK